jgi:hypothetical protein
MKKIRYCAVRSRKSFFEILHRSAHIAFMLLFAGLSVAVTESVVNAQTYSFSVAPMGQFTGEAAELPNNVPTIYNANVCKQQMVYGTDLGVSYPVTIGGQKKMRFLFGDTFGFDVSGSTRTHRLTNTLATTTDTSAADGITGITFLWTSNDLPLAREVIPISEYWSDGYNKGIYPSAGVSVGTREYIYTAAVSSIYPWTYYEGRWWYSDDEWATHTKTSVSNNGQTNWELAAAVKGNGYVYFYGIPSSRSGGPVQLMRIKETDLSSWLVSGTPTKYPEKYTSYGWKSWNSIYGFKNIISSGVSMGSGMYLGGNISKYMMFYTNYNTNKLEARLSSNPEGTWGSATAVKSMLECPVYRGTYYPVVLPDYSSCSGNTCTVYFILSRQSPMDKGAYNTCNSYTCSNDTGSPTDCHQVYNTFLMKMTVTKQ